MGWLYSEGSVCRNVEADLFPKKKPSAIYRCPSRKVSLYNVCDPSTLVIRKIIKVYII